MLAVMMLYASCKSTQLPVDTAQKEVIDVQKNTADSGIRVPSSIPASKVSGGSSGMAQIDPTTYIAVYDLKSFEEGVRVGIISTYPDSIVVEAVYIDDWNDEGGKSSDLESISKIPGRTNEFLMAESGNWQGKGGRIFHFKLDRKTNSAEILGVTQFPMLAENNFNVTGDQYEGMACLAKSDNEITLLLAERGGSDIFTSGILKWANYNLLDHTISFTTDGKKGIKIDAPGEWPDPATNRDITDLRIDKQNRVWAAASQDLGDAGPFYSTIYELGTLSGDPERPVSVHQKLEAWREIPGFKIEALSGASLSAPSSLISFGTEDEFYGGVWRAIR